MQAQIRRKWLLVLAVLASCQTNADNADDDLRREAMTSTGEGQDQMAVRSEIAPLANGRGMMLRRTPQMRNAVVGHRSADGTITTSCVDDADSVAALLRDPSHAVAHGVSQ
jgi:hypothetical protein